MREVDKYNINSWDDEMQSLAREIIALLNGSQLFDECIDTILNLIVRKYSLSGACYRIMSGDSFVVAAAVAENSDTSLSSEDKERYAGFGNMHLDEDMKYAIESSCNNSITLSSAQDDSISGLWINDYKNSIKDLSEQCHSCVICRSDSLAIIPLFSGDELLGVLQLHGAEEYRFSIEMMKDLDFICALIGSTAIIKTCRRMNEQKYEMLYNITRIIEKNSSERDIDQMMSHIIDYLRKSFNIIENGLIEINFNDKLYSSNKADLPDKSISPECCENDNIETLHFSRDLEYVRVEYSPQLERVNLLKADIFDEIAAEILNALHKSCKEKYLTFERDQLNAVFENIPGITLLLDDQRRVINANSKALEMIGDTLENIRGKYGGEAMNCIHAEEYHDSCGFRGVCDECVVRNTVQESLRSRTPIQQKEAELTMSTPEGAMELSLLVSACPVEISGEQYSLVYFEDITELNQKKKEILKREEVFRSLVTTLSAGVVRQDLNLRYLYAAPNTIAHLGLRPETLIGKTMKEVGFSRKSYEFREKIMRKVIATGEPIETDYNVMINGIERMYNWRANPEYDDSGEMISILSVFTDISESRLASRELEKTTAFLQAALDNSMAGIAILEAPDGRIRYINKAGIFNSNISKTDIEGNLSSHEYNRDWQYYDVKGEPIAVEDLPGIKALRSGKVVSQEVMIRDQAGNEKTLWIQAAPIFNPDNVVDSVVVVYPDITEQKKIEYKLKLSDEIFSTVFHASIDTIFVLEDSTGNILNINNRCDEMFGISREVAIGDTTLALGIWSDPNDRELIIQHFTECDSLYSATCQMSRIDGRMFTATVTAMIIIVADTRYKLLSVHDISDSIRLNEQLKQAEKMAAIGQLAGGIAHDFNNQLTGILGFADIIKSSSNDKNLVEYTEHIIKSANHSASLTQQLLAFSRKGLFKSQPVNINGIVKDVIIVLSRSINKKIEVISNLNAAEAIVTGDATQLQNALLNLALNASDAIENTGTISIETDEIYLEPDNYFAGNFKIKGGKYIQIAVSDTGTGIPTEVKDHIFEPFFTTKEEGKGTGMGLAAVFGTVKYHKGAIKFVSAVNVGTTFVVFLPLATEVVEEKTVEVEEFKPVTRENKGTVMLVDDEDVALTLCTEMLKQLGYTVLPFKVGGEALDHYKADYSEIDLVIMDIIMPDKNGYELYNEMRAINPDINIIFASGYREGELEQEVIESGELDIISKPFHFAKLAESVSKYIK